MRSMVILLFTVLTGTLQAQQGEKSIAAGPLISFPVETESNTWHSDLKTGLGLEAIGQYNFSDRSALLLKATLANWRYKKGVLTYGSESVTYLSLQGGYKLTIGHSGIFVNGLVGLDNELQDSYNTISFTLGAGKRFVVKNNRFIDAGIDFVGADAQSRVNIKVLFSLLRWPGKD